MGSKTSLEKADYYTQKGGDICRTMAFGGLAFIWLLHLSIVGKENSLIGSTIPSELKLPAFLLIICLTIDALQYLSGAILWGIQGFKNPKSDSASHKIINFLLLSAVCLKLLAMGFAYIFLAFATKSLWW